MIYHGKAAYLPKPFLGLLEVVVVVAGNPKKWQLKKASLFFFEMKAKAAPHLVLRMSTKKGGIYLREFLSYFQLGNFLTFFCRFCIFTNINYIVEIGYIT